MPRPVIDEDLCVGCFTCTIECESDVFDEEPEVGARPTIKNPDRCNGCDRCVNICPVSAIKIADLQDKLQDMFYAYIGRAYSYKLGATDAFAKSLESRFGRKLTKPELVHACLLSYFELPLEDTNFYRCWNLVGESYKEKLPEVFEMFDTASREFNRNAKRTDFKKLLGGLLPPEGATSLQTSPKKEFEGLGI